MVRQSGTLDLGNDSVALGTLNLAGGTIQNGVLTGSAYNLQAGTISAVLAGSSFASGGTAFLVAGVPIDRGAVVAKAGLDRQISPDMTLGVSYSGQVGDRANDGAAKGNFTWKF